MNTTSFMFRRAGFTLTETIFATCIFAAVSAGIYSVFVQSQLDIRSGTSQASFIAMARLSQQQITELIQEGQAVSIYDNYIDIQTTNNQVARISFVDGDSNPNSADDNVLRYIPNAIGGSEGRDLCRFVMPIGDAMFQALPTSPMSVMIRYHVGDGMMEEDRDAHTSGRGYQGVEVRFSATPRNLPSFHQSN